MGGGHCLKMEMYILSPKMQNLLIRNIPQKLIVCTKHAFQSRALGHLKIMYSKFSSTVIGNRGL